MSNTTTHQNHRSTNKLGSLAGIEDYVCSGGQI